MTLLLTADELATRAELGRGALAPLAASLRSDLDALLERGVVIPVAKALLSRDGGRCPRDGALLTFDPFRADAHRCPVCGGDYGGERHFRAWVLWRQLWLAERAVHAAALYAITGESALARLASEILDGYAECYLAYPNRDNVLGPSRPFFSTYLEAIWLLQVCVALDLLEMSGAEAPGARVRDRVIEPSAELIETYDEGGSNRQVWNNASLMAANRLLGRPAGVRRAVSGPSGLVAHLDRQLLSDGSWYEGENYHLFAHRGLWYGVVLAEHAGLDLPAELVARFQEGFAAPLATALPDLTLPSRRDSQYAISLRQWRFAESCELGLARAQDERLVGALWALYTSDLPRGDTGRWRSTAEAERNEPASALSRADLGWRSLLCCQAELPPPVSVVPRSSLLAAQGIAVFRRSAGRVYVALDYGHSGGGHGHPDRLNLLLADGDRRVLDDMGTGSYVDPSLHWYRSTLAHNAPLFDGRSQGPATGHLVAYDERGSIGWIQAEVPAGAIAPGVKASRSLVVMPDYAVDRITWRSGQPVICDVPIHLAATVEGVGSWREADPVGGTALGDGFVFLRDTACARAPAGTVVHLIGCVPGSPEAWVLAGDAVEWWRAVAPGAPGHGDAPFLFVRLAGTRGRLTAVWSWDGSVAGAGERDDSLVVAMRDGAQHVHRRRDSGWRVDVATGPERRRVDLAGLQPRRRRQTPPPATATAVSRRIPRLEDRDGGSPLRFRLEEQSYRRSEQSWEEAGAPRAEVALAVMGDHLRIGVRIWKTPLVFREPDAPDPALDNEHPDIHSDGVQLHVLAPGWSEPAAWLAVPDVRTGQVRVHEVDGARSGVPLTADWRLLREEEGEETPGGYAVDFAIPLSALGPGPVYSVALDVIVNDMAPDRERRRGQLVLSGGNGEFVYLRGDRQAAARLLPFDIGDD